jgi:penicillin-binding protein 1C
VGEIPLYELLRAYTVFADDGKVCDFRAVPSTASYDPEESFFAPGPRSAAFSGAVESLSRTSGSDAICRAVANPSKVAEIVRILTNRAFKLREFGIDTALDFQDRTVFVKTGTSRNFRDNYAVGFTKNYLLAVWSGNKDGSNMKGVSGATGAGEIFSKIVAALEMPDGAPKEEKITAPIQGYLKILFPLDGSRYRFDPAIPSRLQEIVPKFATDISFDRAEWKLDGKPLGTGGIGLADLSAGGHQLELILRTADGKVRTETSEFRKDE